MIVDLVQFEVFTLFLIFCRIGTIALLMPTLGETYIPTRARLLFTLGFTLLVVTIVGDSIPPMPSGATAMVMLIGGEIIVGLMIGLTLRIFVVCLATAGTIMSFVSGFANAQLFNPAISAQGSLQSVFLSMFGALLILETDLHHLMLRGMIDSYALFEPGLVPDTGDMALMMARNFANSFEVAMRIASPFIVVGIVFYVILGITNRLMPQLQVFFIALPLQIMLGLFVFFVSIGAMMTVFLQYFSESLSGFILLN